MVSPLTGSLNVTCGVTFKPTPKAPFGGSTKVTEGPVVSVLVPVVKLKLPGLVSGLPAVSVTCAL